MAENQQNLLFRLRAETLRLNLVQAQRDLNNLPNLSDDLKRIRQNLENAAVGANAIRTAINGWRNTIADLKFPEREEMVRYMGAQWDRSLQLAGDLEMAAQDLTDIEDRSFLVKAKSIDRSIWTDLTDRAKDLQEEASIIEQGPANASGWTALANTENTANQEVFNESIEFLGGFALRDARLDAEVCELADRIIELIYGPSATALRAIPGGIAAIKMKLGRIVRLRFPEWTIWALPLVAHDVWRLGEWPQLTKRLKDRFQEDGGKAGLYGEGLELCLADAFATYTMGPAYAYTAIALLLNPRHPEDEMRVRIILRVLSGDSCSCGGMGGSYQDVAAELRRAWEEAMADTGARPSSALDNSGLDALVQRLRAMPPSSPEFTLDQWMPLHEWGTRLLGNASDLEALLKSAASASYDLRHGLNAAWLARVSSVRNPADDLTKKSMDLAAKLKGRSTRASTGDPRGPLRP
jgi:hypothetical protein